MGKSLRTRENMSGQIKFSEQLDEYHSPLSVTDTLLLPFTPTSSTAYSPCHW